MTTTGFLHMKHRRNILSSNKDLLRLTNFCHFDFLSQRLTKVSEPLVQHLLLELPVFSTEIIPCLSAVICILPFSCIPNFYCQTQHVNCLWYIKFTFYKKQQFLGQTCKQPAACSLHLSAPPAQPAPLNTTLRDFALLPSFHWHNTE